MQAFHNDKNVKAKYVNRVMEHQKMDRLVKGATGDNNKGCAVACTLDMVYDHSRYPVELGIPEWLAHVEDTLFEGMSLHKSLTFPEKFLKAIKVGADLEKAKVPFLIEVMKSSLQSVSKVKYDKKRFPEVTKVIVQSKVAINQMIKAQRSGNAAVIQAAYSAAVAAAVAAYSAAVAVAAAAVVAAAVVAVAAYSAAYSAADLAMAAADSAAYSVADSAAAVDSAAYSVAAAWDSAACTKTYNNLADKLLEILKKVK